MKSKCCDVDGCLFGNQRRNNQIPYWPELGFEDPQIDSIPRSWEPNIRQTIQNATITNLSAPWGSLSPFLSPFSLAIVSTLSPSLFLLSFFVSGLVSLLASLCPHDFRFVSHCFHSLVGTLAAWFYTCLVSCAWAAAWIQIYLPLASPKRNGK